MEINVYTFMKISNSIEENVANSYQEIILANLYQTWVFENEFFDIFVRYSSEYLIPLPDKMSSKWGISIGCNFL